MGLRLLQSVANGVATRARPTWGSFPSGATRSGAASGTRSVHLNGNVTWLRVRALLGLKMAHRRLKDTEFD